MLTKHFIKTVTIYTFSSLAIIPLSQGQVTASGGSANTLPVFTGSSALGPSLISQSAGTIQMNGPVSSATAAGQTLFSAHQQGAGYAYGSGMFTAATDNLTGSANYYFSGLTGDATNFFVRADGLIYTAGQADFSGWSFLSGMRATTNNYASLFLGGAISDAGNGNYTVMTDGGSNFFGAIRMDNAGGNAGAINFYTGPTVSGSSYSLTNAQLASYERMSIVGSDVGIGTAAPSAKLEVNGTTKFDAQVTYPDGSVQNVAWNGILSGGDYAESVDVGGDRSQYEPGDVLVIDHESEKLFLKSSEPYSTAVMGIYSTRPGVVGRRQLSDRSHMKEEVPMAMVGVVPTKVCEEGGPIRPGDLLVTSSRPGYAMKGTDRTRLTGAIIGKALERLDKETGMIEVAVSLQ